jgi:16S rRNA (guanine1516-N2)-methyltransferase
MLRAVRFKEDAIGMLAVDATAGLGEDSFILAAAGFSVLMCEYNPVIAALLSDALVRAQRDPDIGEIARRMELREGNGIDILGTLGWKPDVIYLDPMFPAKKKSGISTKKLQIFQKLETPCANEEELLAAAFAADPRRIVVKRPIKGEPLAGKKPGFSIDCRNVRYDCYVVRS